MGVFLLIFFFLKALEVSEGMSNNDRTAKGVDRSREMMNKKAKVTDRNAKMKKRLGANVD